MHKHTCTICNAEFESKSRVRKYCGDRCRYKANDKPRGTCRICGDAMWIGKGSKPTGEGAHNKCLSLQHGTRGSYQRGCRCKKCTEANRVDLIKFREGYKERNGASIQSIHKRKFKDEHGYWPQRERDWISYTDRQAIYERDNWHCYLCDEAIDSTLHYNDDMAASLDHVTPRSKGGTDEQSNLRAVHRSCNSRKGNREIEAQKILSLAP